MMLKNFFLFFSLVCALNLNAAAEIKWDSVDHPGPRGKSNLTLAAIATAATILGVSAFAYVTHDATVLKKWYRKVKRYPFETITAFAVVAGIAMAVATNMSMPVITFVKKK